MAQTASAVIHLINDDDAVREALAFSLTAAGLAIRVYASARDFLSVLTTIQPGCIVTDVQMPGLSGIELLRELKARDVDMPMIVMTGHGDVALAVEAMKAGAVDSLKSQSTTTRC